MTPTLDFSNKNFQLASSFIQYTNENVFLTGKAGTGKTTFLKYIKEQCDKNYVLTAPTGVAAINAGGVTLHSFFQLPLGTYIADFRKNWGAEEDSYIVNKQQLLSKLRINSNKRKLIREMQLLIIDEISMVRADTLDAVDAIMRHIRNKHDEIFGGVQLLFIGDLYQLPPVVRNQEMSIMNEHYRSPFFFDALSLRENIPICVELDQIYRQDDPLFIQVLNNIRNNELDQDDFNILNERYIPGYTPSGDAGIITLTSHNAQADEINQNALQELTSKEKTLTAKVTGDFPENAFPIEKELVLKEGAQVMFIKNDKGENRRFYNGKIGTVNRINITDKEIEIYFPKEKNSITIQQEAWENIKFKLNEDKNIIEEDVVGTFEQYPFRLAWAVTIHKSQGLTFEEAVIDAGRSFAAGQVYVALSRMTTLKGMVLRSQITPASVMVDPRIIEFMRNKKSADAQSSKLKVGQFQYLLNELINAYQWSNLIVKMEGYLSESISVLTQELIITKDIYKKALGACYEMDKVGIGFTHELGRLYHHKHYEELITRLSAANTWFIANMDSNILHPFKEWQQELKVQKGGAKVTQALGYIMKQVRIKKDKILKLPNAISVLQEENNLTKALDALKKEEIAGAPLVVEEEKKEPVVKGKSAHISLELFQQKYSPEEIADKRNMAVGTIFSHLIQHVQTGAIKALDLINEEKLLEIVDKKKQNPTSTLSEMKIILDDAYTYNEIKVAFAFLDYLNAK